MSKENFAIAQGSPFCDSEVKTITDYTRIQRHSQAGNGEEENFLKKIKNFFVQHTLELAISSGGPNWRFSVYLENRITGNWITSADEPWIKDKR